MPRRADRDGVLRELRHQDQDLHVELHLGELWELHRPGGLLPGRDPVRVLRKLRHQDQDLHVELHLGELRKLHRPGGLLPGHDPVRGLRKLRQQNQDLHVELHLGELRKLHRPGGLQPRGHHPERLRPMRAEDLQQLLHMERMPAPSREDLSMGERHELGVLRLSQVALLPATKLRGHRVQMEHRLRLGGQRLLLEGMDLRVRCRLRGEAALTGPCVARPRSTDKSPPLSAGTPSARHLTSARSTSPSHPTSSPFGPSHEFAQNPISTYSVDPDPSREPATVDPVGCPFQGRYLGWKPLPQVARLHFGLKI